MLALDRAEHRRRKRGYGQRHPEALNDHRREKRGPVGAVLRSRQGEKQEAHRDGERRHYERHPRPEAGADAPGEAADQEGHRHERQEHATRDEGRVAVNLHHEERQEVQRAGQGHVEQERHQVCAAEAPGAEQRGGTIGSLARRSTKTKAERAITPRTRAASTRRVAKTQAEDSIRA